MGSMRVQAAQHQPKNGTGFSISTEGHTNRGLAGQGEFHLDISASQRIGKKFSAFLQLNNLTDQKEREFFGDPSKDISRIHQTEGYGFWGSIGLRYNY